MKWKNRFTNYNFWVSMVSAVLLVLQACNIKFDVAHINEIITAVLGLLVVIGIINDPTKSNETKTAKSDITQTPISDQTPIEQAATDNQKNEIDIASQNAGENVVQDVYPEIEGLVNSCEQLQNQEVFVAETNDDLQVENHEIKDNSGIYSLVLPNEIVPQQHCEDEFGNKQENLSDDFETGEQTDNIQSISEVGEVENSQISPQPKEPNCFKIVN